MWTVVYLSKNKDKIDRLIEILNSRSVMTMVRKSNKSVDTVDAYEILVPQTEIETAQDIIFDAELSDNKN